jgi:uncharacterized protein YjiS (DUF1127 family)
MPFADQISDRRSSPQRRLPRRTDPRPIHDRDLHSTRDGTLVLSLPQDASRRRIPPALSSLTVTAATTLCAGNAFPGLLLAVFSWLIAEFLAACAAYGQAMHAPPQAAVSPPADAPGPEEVKSSRDARPRLTPISTQANRDAARNPAPRHPLRLAAACWSRIRQAQTRRRTMEELKNLDDRSLRDIGLCQSDVEHIARYGARRE